ncbi:MAG: ATP-grasp domain-containing protein [Planctomycetota bacterium]|nr:ATP-grasp domain-containing protein [Planctomycetota bacterium]
MPVLHPNSPLLIVGASVRSAAQSALRAGYTPVCADAFADADLRACAHVLPVADFPNGLSAALSGVPAIPWIYTGGLENHPALLQRLSRERPLLGNSADVVRQVRNPRRVTSVLKAAKLPALEIQSFRIPPPTDGTWMLKPRRGSAGRGVVVWTPAHCDHPTRSEPHYFQRRVSGAEYSALFLARGPNVEPALIGISRQLIGISAANAPTATAWCGNLAPARVDPSTERTMYAAGAAIAGAFALCGLFGCDFLVADGIPWVTEINPRYTGSVELFEWHQRRSWFRDHVLATQVDPPVSAPTAPREPVESVSRYVPSVIGKLIVYATRDTAYRGEFPSRLGAAAVNDLWTVPNIADIPATGQPIPAGTPICTVFGVANDEESCLGILTARATDFHYDANGDLLHLPGAR